MSQVTVSAEATSPASADRVFDVLTDWPRHPEWMPFTRAEGGHEVGAELRGWTGIGRVGFLDTMVITEWVPGRRVAVRHTGKLIRGDASFETSALADGGGKVVWTERVDLPLGPLGRAGWVAVGPLMRRFMGIGLRRLVRLAEVERAGS